MQEIEPPSVNINKKSPEKPPLPPGEGTVSDTEIITIATPSEIQASIGKSTPDPHWENKKQKQTQLLSYASNIKTPEIFLAVDSGKVAGAYTQKNIVQEKHWAVALIDEMWKVINFYINRLILKL